MPQQTLIIFTAKTVEQILEDGGSQSWALDRAHAKACEYAVLCRNLHTDWGTGREPHGSAFLVGRICDVVRCSDPDRPERWLVKFDHYALVNEADVWGGWRNPIRYCDQPPFSLHSLAFTPMPDAPQNLEADLAVEGILPGLSMEQAKIGVAARYGVPLSAIEIVIRG